MTLTVPGWPPLPKRSPVSSLATSKPSPFGRSTKKSIIPASMCAPSDSAPQTASNCCQLSPLTTGCSAQTCQSIGRVSPSSFQLPCHSPESLAFLP